MGTRSDNDDDREDAMIGERVHNKLPRNFSVVIVVVVAWQVTNRSIGDFY